MDKAVDIHEEANSAGSKECSREMRDWAHCTSPLHWSNTRRRPAPHPTKSGLNCSQTRDRQR